MINYELTSEIKRLNSEEWNNILTQFKDATIYQTEEFSRNSVGGDYLEQFTVKHDNTVISAALIRVKILPMLNRGIAYIRWAPLWQKTNSETNYDIFDKTLNLLLEEYVLKRKLMLRIMSNLDSADERINESLKKNNFNSYTPNSKSIIVDISEELDTIRARFRKKWRYSLKQAEKKDLEIKIGSDDFLFDEFLDIYKSMHSRKGFEENIDVESFKKINSSLDEKNKLKIFICFKDNNPLSAMVVSAIGNTGIYLLGGTTAKGLELSSSYLLQWEVIKYLKSNEVSYYDLGGIDEKENPGVYTFKSGMGGKEINYVSGIQASKNILSKLIIKIGELIK